TLSKVIAIFQEWRSFPELLAVTSRNYTEMSRNWSSGGATPGGVQPRPAVYGAQYPPLQHAAAAAALSSPSRQPKNKQANKLQDYENSVSDAWTTSVQLDDDQVMSAAQRVLAQHAAASREEEIMPPVGVTPAKNSRIQAMQRLAIQKGPLPSKGGAAEAAPAPSLYPRLVDTSTEETTRSSAKGAGGDRDAARFERLRRALSVNGETEVDMGRLREDCWLGIAHRMRPAAWRILSGYMPTKKERREATLKMKRDEYWHYVEQYFHTRFQDGHSDTFRQISIDIPRMSPLIQLFQQKLVQEIFERILYIWAIRHPASGYVQGINDLVTPFFVVFLSEFVPAHAEVGSFDVSQLDIETQQLVEADSFWCVSSLLDAVLDNYTFAQPGIQRKVLHLAHLMGRVDPSLYAHLKAHQVEYLQFAFRWMNNVLMREMPLRATIRLWDTYLSEVNGFAQFHGYVCAAFLRTFSRQIQAEKDFQGIMILLQNLPTSTWGDQQICELTADAFSLMQASHSLFWLLWLKSCEDTFRASPPS
ncbi:tbc-3, partial [Pristionchus pacificus]